jgi:hypothetical protein
LHIYYSAKPQLVLYAFDHSLVFAEIHRFHASLDDDIRPAILEPTEEVASGPDDMQTLVCISPSLTGTVAVFGHAAADSAGVLVLAAGLFITVLVLTYILVVQRQRADSEDR